MDETKNRKDFHNLVISLRASPDNIKLKERFFAIKKTLNKANGTRVTNLDCLDYCVLCAEVDTKLKD